MLSSFVGGKSDEGKFCDTTLVFVFPPKDKKPGGNSNFNPEYVMRLFGEGKIDRRVRGPYSHSSGEFVFVSLKLSTLKKRADQEHFLVQLDPQELEKSANDKGKTIKDLPEKSTIKPYEFIFTEYDENNIMNKWLKSQDYNMKREHPFSACAQIKIANAHVQKTLALESVEISQLIEDGILLGYFPLHDKGHLQAMKHEWTQGWKFPWELPIDVIRNYMGEKIGFYFKFLVHYTAALVPLAAVGVACQVVVFTSGNPSNPIIVFFATFAVIWGTIMMKTWKRQESLTALKWGMESFERTEMMRPAFLKIAKKVRNWTKHGYTHDYDRSHWLKPGIRKFFSSTVVTILNILVLCTTASIYVAKYELDQTPLHPYTNYIASALNSLQIFVFGMICKASFTSLNNFENHRTDTEYEDAMIMKYLCFQFVNSFSSFYYIAFIASYVTVLGGAAQCGLESCMEALGVNVLIVLITSATADNFSEWILPAIMLACKRTQGVAEGGGGGGGGCFGCCKGSDPEKVPLRPLNEKELAELDQAIVEFGMDQYDYLQEGFEDYAELFIQFGYMSLFLTSLPAISLMNLIVTYMEVYGDQGKLVSVFRRVMPLGAEDIGSWQAVFEFITTLAVPTNAGIIIFTMGTFSSEPFSTQLWYFIVYQWVMFAVIIMYQTSVKDVPEMVTIQKERTEWILDNITRDPNFYEEVKTASKIGSNMAQNFANNVINN